MKTIFFILCCLFLNLFSINAQNRLERKLLKAIKSESSFDGAQVGVTVIDLKKRKKIVTIDSDKRILPASLVKLITVNGGIQKFGDSLPALHYTKVKKRFYNDDLEFKISSIHLLSEIVDKEVRDVILRVDVNDISEKLVEEVVQIVSKHKGKHSLVFILADHLNKYEVDLLSRKMKVDLSKEFFSQIGELNQFELKVK